MRLYTYGIIDSGRRIDESILGLEGARVYNVPYCDIGAIVSELATGSVQDITKQSVLAHEEVVEKLDRLRNKVEFGIKVIWPSDKIKERIVNACRKSCKKAFVPTDSPNSRFMRDNFEQYRLNEELGKKADKFVGIMDMFFSKFAAEKNSRN